MSKDFGGADILDLSGVRMAVSNHFIKLYTKDFLSFHVIFN